MLSKLLNSENGPLCILKLVSIGKTFLIALLDRVPWAMQNKIKFTRSAAESSSAIKVTITQST